MYSYHKLDLRLPCNNTFRIVCLVVLSLLESIMLPRLVYSYHKLDLRLRCNNTFRIVGVAENCDRSFNRKKHKTVTSFHSLFSGNQINQISLLLTTPTIET